MERGLGRLRDVAVLHVGGRPARWEGGNGGATNVQLDANSSVDSSVTLTGGNTGRGRGRIDRGSPHAAGESLIFDSNNLDLR